MVAVARQQYGPAEVPAATPRSVLPEHLLHAKKSPIARRLAEQEAARLERSRRIARERPPVSPRLPLVADRPLVEYARAAGRPIERCGLIDAYTQRMETTPRTTAQAAGLIPPTRPLGRATQSHYTALHAGSRPALPRLRVGIPRWRPNGENRFAMRMAIATLAAVIVVIGAFGTGFAQQRYEVQEGDTLDSVATMFGVDPAAIASSSYMPNGDALAADQVIIIPEVGQSAEDAAVMAAAQEGTSPWVVAAHWVEWGDTLDSIGVPYGVTGAQLVEFNEIADPQNVVPGTRILIPVARDSEEAIVAPVPSVVVPNVPMYKQSRNLSCEYAATHIATGAFGDAIAEQTLIDTIPVTLNPHLGYRGNIDGAWGNTDDYGIYPEALAPTLNAYGFAADIFYAEGDTSQLTAQIDAGHPVIVWLGLWGDTRVQLTDEGDYSVAAGMHVMTVYGYSDEGVFLADPATGGTKFYNWDAFLPIWNVLDGMAMAVYPA